MFVPRYLGWPSWLCGDVHVFGRQHLGAIRRIVPDPCRRSRIPPGRCWRRRCDGRAVGDLKLAGDRATTLDSKRPPVSGATRPYSQRNDLLVEHRLGAGQLHNFRDLRGLRKAPEADVADITRRAAPSAPPIRRASPAGPQAWQPETRCDSARPGTARRIRVEPIRIPPRVNPRRRRPRPRAGRRPSLRRRACSRPRRAREQAGRTHATPG